MKRSDAWSMRYHKKKIYNDKNKIGVNNRHNQILLSIDTYLIEHLFNVVSSKVEHLILSVS